MSKLKIVQLESFYPLFMQEIYAGFGGLKNLSFDAQIGYLLGTGFSGGHNVVPYLDPSRWDSAYIVVNCPWSQAQWAIEQRLDASLSARDILLAQLKNMRPDILYLSDIPGFDFSLLAELNPRPLVVGWHATALSSTTPWREFDLVLSGITKIRESALAHGARAVAEYMPAAPAFRSSSSNAGREGALVFSGSFYGGIHDARARQLAQVSRRIGSHRLEIYTPNTFAIDPADQIDFYPAVYGNGVLDLYSRYNIVLDSRGEFGLNDRLEPRETSNMRLFEATRVGALLLTENSPNLSKYFDVGTEIETYGSFDELVDKINYFSDPHRQEERQRIARAGLLRVRQNHLIEHRATWLEKILDTHFDLRLAARTSGTVARSAGNVSQAYCLIADLDSLLFTLSMVDYLHNCAPSALIYLVCESEQVRHLISSGQVNVVLMDQVQLLSEMQQGQIDDPLGRRFALGLQLVKRIFASNDALQRVTYLNSDTAWSQPLVFQDGDESIYAAHFDLGVYTQLAEDLLGRNSLSLFSVARTDGSLNLIDLLLHWVITHTHSTPLGRGLDDVLASIDGDRPQFQFLRIETPWSLKTAVEVGHSVVGSFLGPMSFVNHSQWQFATFDSAPAWSQWVATVYVPYLQRVQGVMARLPGLGELPDQHSPATASAHCQFLLRQDYLLRGGYRLLSAQQYQSAAVQTGGWDTPSVAQIQHHAFQELLAHFRAGKQRADMLALTRLFTRLLKPEMRVLEEGCGSGYNSELIGMTTTAQWHYSGIDIAAAMIDLARASYPQHQFEVMQSEQLAYADASFDIVLNGASLMHTIGYEQALAQARRVASKFVVLHTITVGDLESHIHFEKDAYGSRVAEVCFSRRQLLALLAKYQLLPVYLEDSIDYNLEPVVGVPTQSVSIGCFCMSDAAQSDRSLPSNHYCTYFDVNYLPRGVLMIRSLLRHDPQALIFVLCLDEITEKALTTLSPNIKVIPIRELLVADEAFASARDTRTLIEWYFTATSCLANYLIAQYPDIPKLIYLDADLYFYSTPEFLIDEARDASVQIIEHRFSPQYANLVMYGRFNVAWIGFANTPEGRSVIQDYRANCLAWCYDRLEGDRFGDQKYLDKWPQQFANCCVSGLLGANVAWWNMARWTPKRFDSLTYVGSDLLIFYHFQEIKRSKSGEYSTKKEASEYGDYYALLYAPYLMELTQIDRELSAVINNLSITDIRYKSW
jgi:SAM-dependent methyltransferase